MKHLWQRIFAYTVILILISQGAVLLLHRYSQRSGEAQRFIATSVRAVASAMDGQSRETANAVANLFSRRGTRTWVEDKNGTPVAGTRPEDPAMLEAGQGKAWQVDAIDIRETRKGGMYFLASMPVDVDGSPMLLRMTFSPPRRSAMWNMLFLQGIVALSFVALMLALWMAHGVSRPLRALRNEVMDIAGGNLERRVSVSGKDEIADVAVAVNHMADTLARNIRSMKELVANISHEMRSPLARMQVSLALLEEDASPLPRETADIHTDDTYGHGPHAPRHDTVTGSGASARSHIQRLREEMEHMNRLIGATLLTSKLDLQPRGPLAESVALSDLCLEMCRRHEPLFTERNIRLVPNVTPGLTVAGDETLLSQLVSNLLDNAAAYAEPGGEATLRLAPQGNGESMVALEVENTHAPLPQDVLERIFEPFYRGGRATGGGVGLGLSLVAKIAALHGGDTAASNTVTGVRFTVCLARNPQAGNP